MKSRTTGRIASAAMVMLLGLTVWAVAAPQADTGVTSRAYLHSMNLPSTGVAIEGYCPVAYHAVNKPVKGKPEYASDHNGVTYWFVSDDARQAFDASPEKYLPAYGGWCAFGMSIGDKFPIDPHAFKIQDGKLLLFLRNEGVDARALWNNGDLSENTRKAAAHWQKVQG